MGIMQAMTKPDIWMPVHIGNCFSETVCLLARQLGSYLLLIVAAWKSSDDLTLVSTWTNLASALQLHPQAADDQRHGGETGGHPDGGARGFDGAAAGEVEQTEDQRH